VILGHGANRRDGNQQRGPGVGWVRPADVRVADGLTMNAFAASDSPAYDRVAATAILCRVLAMPGGAELVTASLAQIPGAVVTYPRSGRFRSSVASAQLGLWRYSPAAAGRIMVAHVVGGFVVSEDSLPPAAAAPHITAAIGQHLADYGPYILHDVVALLEGLAVASS
jgi:hypothetical protein